MGLDALLAFQNVRIDGTLGQELDAFQLFRFFRKHFDKFAADDLTFGFRITDSCQLTQETFCRVHVDQVGFHLITEHFDDLFRFPFAQKPVVHMHTHQLLSYRFNQQRGHNGRIHAPGQCQQYFFITNLFP